MKCERTGEACGQPERCEILGCLTGIHGRPAKPAAAPTPPAAPDEPRLFGFERATVALQDRLTSLLVRKPKPAAAPQPSAPPPADERDAMELIQEILMQDQPAERRLDANAAQSIASPTSGVLAVTGAQPTPSSWQAQAASPLKPTQRPRDIRVVSVPSGGFLVIEDNAPIAIGLDAGAIGAAVARVLA